MRLLSLEYVGDVYMCVVGRGKYVCCVEYLKRCIGESKRSILVLLSRTNTFSNLATTWYRTGLSMSIILYEGYLQYNTIHCVYIIYTHLESSTLDINATPSNGESNQIYPALSTYGTKLHTHIDSYKSSSEHHYAHCCTMQSPSYSSYRLSTITASLGRESRFGKVPHHVASTNPRH